MKFNNYREESELILLNFHSNNDNRFVFNPEIFDSVHISRKRKRLDKSSSFTFVKSDVKDEIRKLQQHKESEKKEKKSARGSSKKSKKSSKKSYKKRMMRILT
jgi:hypothetical protein